jgi:hypothetical protein
MKIHYQPEFLFTVFVLYCLFIAYKECRQEVGMRKFLPSILGNQTLAREEIYKALRTRGVHLSKFRLDILMLQLATEQVIRSEISESGIGDKRKQIQLFSLRND